MKIKSIIFVVATFIIFLAGCEKDNYKAPDSFLTGTLNYQGTPVPLRSNGVQIELWQHGFQLFTSKIPVWVDQNGQYSTQIFDGDYKMTLVKGNGPWVDKTDSIDVKVKGNTVVDFPVEPFILLKDVVYTKSGSAPSQTVTVTFSIRYVNTSKALSTTKLFLSTTAILDNNTNLAALEKKAGTTVGLIPPGATSATIGPLTIPASLATKPFIYARVGAQAVGVTEYVYSDAVKITLP